MRSARPSDEPIVRQSTANLDAYQAYLRGRFFVNRLTGQFEALFAARDAFQEAVTLDPDYAAAYAGLSEAYCSLAYLTFLPTREASEAALAAAHRAVELDPVWRKHTRPSAGPRRSSPSTWPPRSRISSARSSSRPASRPRTATTCSCSRRSAGSAKRWRVRSGRVSSTRSGCRGPFNICITLICARQFEKAERVVRDIMALDANLEGTYWFLSSALAGQGRLDEAIAPLEKGVPLVYRAPLFVALLGLWYARAGRRADAEALLEELIAGGRCPPVWFAILYAGLGDLERAIGFLDRAIDEHNDQVCFMMVDHRFDELRAHPRFDSLLARIGLRPAS